jgi:outer membrane protein
LAGAQAQIRAAEQRLVQARAAFGPSVAATFNRSETRYDEAPSFDTRPFASKQAALQLTQPVYRPTLHSAWQGAQAQLAQAQSALDQARADAMQRLVEACFEVLKARDALAFSQAQRAATAEQLASARRSFAVGTSPVTDVREAEAKADIVAAQLTAAQFELELRQQMLAELVGKPVAGLMNRGLRAESLPAVEAPSVLEWLGAGLAQSPQVQQALHAYEVAESEVGKAERAHAPTAEFTASYTMSSETGSITSILPRRYNSRQVGVNVNVPLFASGATQAKVQEAIALRDKAQSDLDAARRTVTLGVRQTFSATLSAISQARGLEAAVRSTELALRANRRGYEVGMKVNAEVLESQTKLFEARRDLSKARYDAWVNFVKLAAISGKAAETDLDLIEGLLVEQAAAVPDSRQPRGAQR